MSEQECISCHGYFPATDEYFYRKQCKGKIIGLEKECKVCEDERVARYNLEAYRRKQLFGKRSE